MEIDENTPHGLTYSDISFEFLNQEMTENISIHNRHILVLVYAGELLVQEGKQRISLKRGDCLFVRSNSRIILIKKSGNNETFRGIMLGLGYAFLKDFFCNTLCNKIYGFTNYDKSIVKLTTSVYIQSLHVSLRPYLLHNIKPCSQLLTLKSQEAVYCLLEADISLYAGIFSQLYLPENPGRICIN